MRVLNLRPMTGAGSVVARFDLELTPDVTLLAMLLKHTAAGYRAFPANAAGRGTASLSPTLAAQITAAARRAMEGERHVKSAA
jgi:hypothetical protein